MVVNLALFGYVVVTDLRSLAAGDLAFLESSTVVAGILLAVGLVLYVVNQMTRSKLDGAGATR